MAPAPTYSAPHVQLGQLMVRARRRGLTFEEWWEEAVRPGQPVVMVTHADPPAGCLRWPTDRNDRVTWQLAISGSRDGWRRAYERVTPTRAEEALLVLADAIGAFAEVAEERVRIELGELGVGIEAHGRLPSAA